MSDAVPPPSPISCETAVRRLWDFLDGRLADSAQVEVEAHLATCERCPPHFAFSARILAALASARPAPDPADPDARALRERVRAALQAAP